MGNAYSNDALPNWQAANVIDGIASSVYSSDGFASAKNDRTSYLAVWTKDGKISASQVQLTARPGNLHFPANYDGYVTSPDNSKWNAIGNFSIQPNSNGLAVIPLGSTVETYGVLIIPKLLGADHGYYYFQLAEVQLAP